MSATTADDPADAASPDEVPPGDMPRRRDVLRAENAKLRSIYRLVLLPAVSVIAILLIGISNANQQQRFVVSIPPGLSPAQSARLRAVQLAEAPDPIGIVFAGIGTAAILLACFGAYCACIEYSNGMIRATLTAVPRRGRLFGAKLAASLLAAAPAIAVSVVAVFWIGDALLARRFGVSVGAFEGSTLLRLFGATVFLLGATVMGFGLGLILRSTAGSVLAVVLVFILFIALLDAVAGQSTQQYLAPALSGARLYLSKAADSSPQPPLAAAYPAFLAWPLLLSAAGYLRFTRSDAG